MATAMLIALTKMNCKAAGTTVIIFSIKQNELKHSVCRFEVPVIKDESTDQVVGYVLELNLL